MLNVLLKRLERYREFTCKLHLVYLPDANERLTSALIPSILVLLVSMRQNIRRKKEWKSLRDIDRKMESWRVRVTMWTMMIIKEFVSHLSMNFQYWIQPIVFESFAISVSFCEGTDRCWWLSCVFNSVGLLCLLEHFTKSGKIQMEANGFVSIAWQWQSLFSANWEPIQYGSLATVENTSNAL